MTTVAQHITDNNLYMLRTMPTLGKQMQVDERAVTQVASPRVTDKVLPPPVVSKKPDKSKKKGSQATPPPAPQRSSSISANHPSRSPKKEKVHFVSLNDKSSDIAESSNLDKSDRQRVSVGSKASSPTEHAQMSPKRAKGNPNSQDVLKSSYNNGVKDSRRLRSILSSQAQMNDTSQKSLLKPRDRLRSLLVDDSNEEDKTSFKDDYGSSYNATLMKISHGDVHKHTVAVTTPLVPSISPQMGQSQAIMDTNISESSQEVPEHSPVKFEEQIIPLNRPRSHTSPLHSRREELDDIATYPDTAMADTNQLSLSNPISRAYRQHLVTRMEQDKLLGPQGKPMRTNNLPRESQSTQRLDQVGIQELPTMSSNLSVSYSQLDTTCSPRALPPTSSMPRTLVSHSNQLSYTTHNVNVFNGVQQQNGTSNAPVKHSVSTTNTASPTSWDNGSYSTQKPRTSHSGYGSPSTLEPVYFFEDAPSHVHGNSQAVAFSGQCYRTLPRSHRYQQHRVSTDPVQNERKEVRKRANSVNNLINGEDKFATSQQDHSSLSPNFSHMVYPSGYPQGVDGSGELYGNQFYKQQPDRYSSCSSSPSTLPTAFTAGPFSSSSPSPGGSQGSQPHDHANPAGLHHARHCSPDLHMPCHSARTQTSQHSSEVKVPPLVLKSPVHSKRTRRQSNPSSYAKAISVPTPASGSLIVQSQVAARGQGTDPHSHSNSEKQNSSEFVEVNDKAGKRGKRGERKRNPKEFILADYISYHSSHFPKRVKITKGPCSDSPEATLSQGNVLDLHFVHQTKSVTMTDSNLIQYTVPMSTLATFSILYDPFSVEKVAISGFHFKTAGAVMDLKNPPAVMASTQFVDGGSSENSLEKGEVLILQGVKNFFHGRLLKVFSIKTKLVKFLDEHCTANFTTNPAMIKMALPQIYDSSILLPQKAILYPTNAMANFVPDSMQTKAVMLKKFTVTKFVVATARPSVEMSSSSECPVLDLDVSLDVDVKEVVAIESEQKKMHRTTQNLANTFDETSVIPYVNTPNPSLQLSLLTNLDPKSSMSYTTEILPPNGITLPKVKTNIIQKSLFNSGSTLKQAPDAGTEQRLKTIEAKQEKIETKVSSMCDRLDCIASKMDKIHTYLRNAQLTMNEHKKNEKNRSSLGASLSSPVSEENSTDFPLTQPKFTLVRGKARHSLSKLADHPISRSVDDNNDDVFVVKATKPLILPKPTNLVRKGQTATTVCKSQKDNELTKKETVKRSTSRPVHSTSKERERSGSALSDTSTRPASFKRSWSGSNDLTEYLLPQTSSSKPGKAMSDQLQRSTTQGSEENKSSGGENLDDDVDITNWCSQMEDELTKLYNDSILSLT